MKIRDLADLEQFTSTLCESINNNSIIMLRGELGVGKTTLSASILKKLVSDLEEFTSPTFNIVHRYHSKLRKCNINHLDLYRIQNYEELYEIGFSDILEDGIVLIEWPQIAFPILHKINSERLMMIDLSFLEEDLRSIALTTPCNMHYKKIES
jgi:tRNA threonylcarbamoyladenosine biosynthesis protein TsaE